MTRVQPGRVERDDAGAATVLVVAVSGVLLVVGLALAAVAGTIAAHRTAQAAADLAALAGAQTLADGAADGCAAADEVARANGAELTACAVTGSEVRLQVEVAGPRFLRHGVDLTAEARAGPV